MKPKIWIAIIAVVVIGFVGGQKVKRFLEIDRCLDHGGSWDYENSLCDTINHPSIVQIWKSRINRFIGKYAFEDFRVDDINHSKRSELDLSSNIEGTNYRTVLTDAYADDSSNFAGHYSFVFYGTGTSAQRSKIIDRHSGQIYDGPDSNHGYKFRLDSKMLITNPPDSSGNYDDCDYCHPSIYALDENSKTFEKLQ